MSDDTAAPATPNGRPVPHPKIRNGASTMLMITLAVDTIIPGLKLPVARSADPIATSANCSASAGMNQSRYASDSLAVSASAPIAAEYGERNARPTTRNTTPVDHREHLRLVEQELGLRVILPPDRVRHHRRRPDAEHLRERQHDEAQVPGDADRRDRLRAEAPDPVQVDQEIQRLEDHRDEHEARGLQQVPREWSRGEILHDAPDFACVRTMIWSLTPNGPTDA